LKTKKKINVILGLDISTSTIGFSFFSAAGELLVIGYLELTKIKTLYKKTIEFKKLINYYLDQFSIIDLYIEAPLLRFSKFSSADTLNKLAFFNGAVSYLIFDLTKIEPKHINATSARSRVVGRIPRKSIAKEKIFNYVKEREKGIYWPTNSKGNFIKQCYDMADSYIIGAYYFA
tara:strand:- start:635 stop:1159 length:525 start_codon:yes stop_codon:yes gene_type:complete